jgi:hypothetical protein
MDAQKMFVDNIDGDIEPFIDEGAVVDVFLGFPVPDGILDYVYPGYFGIVVHRFGKKLAQNGRSQGAADELPCLVDVFDQVIRFSGYRVRYGTNNKHKMRHGV